MSWFKSGPASKPRKPARASGQPSEDGSFLRREESRVRKTLDKCCKYGVPGLAISPDDLTVHQIQFQALTDEELLVRVFAGDEELPFRPMSMCFVSYAAHIKAGIFIARVVTCRWQGGLNKAAPRQRREAIRRASTTSRVRVCT